MGGLGHPVGAARLDEALVVRGGEFVADQHEEHLAAILRDNIDQPFEVLAVRGGNEDQDENLALRAQNLLLDVLNARDARHVRNESLDLLFFRVQFLDFETVVQKISGHPLRFALAMQR
jgi:hypothetical protein